MYISLALFILVTFYYSVAGLHFFFLSDPDSFLNENAHLCLPGKSYANIIRAENVINVAALFHQATVLTPWHGPKINLAHWFLPGSEKTCWQAEKARDDTHKS